MFIDNKNDQNNNYLENGFFINYCTYELLLERICTLEKELINLKSKDKMEFNFQDSKLCSEYKKSKYTIKFDNGYIIYIKDMCFLKLSVNKILKDCSCITEKDLICLYKNNDTTKCKYIKGKIKYKYTLSENFEENCIYFDDFSSNNGFLYLKLTEKFDKSKLLLDEIKTGSINFKF